ncbi:hypothetical protein LOTGIDRAFT_237390 [Lottia gigantea]|uniref:Tetraspanin n=1 Tax=Lottia gigantea TaxID=225164 RepID=V4BA85_LOTGI|nr:hypothetical protein LOTGIDRAFT_237390 [Lottia gigantea]ESP04356.1 hypothetical protein LOTGIDRAFT_237390 [Lottia gigantea]
MQPFDGYANEYRNQCFQQKVYNDYETMFTVFLSRALIGCTDEQSNQLTAICDTGIVAIAIKVKEATGKKTVEMLSKQYEKTYDTSNTASIFLDYYQVENMCCGINGPTDYDKFTKWRENFKQDNISGKSIVPISCCGQQNSTKSYLFLESDGSCPNNGGTQDGCLKPVLEHIQAYDRYIIAAAVIVGLVEVLGLILGLYIAFNVAKDPEYKRMK